MNDFEKEKNSHEEKLANERKKLNVLKQMLAKKKRLQRRETSLQQIRTLSLDPSLENFTKSYMEQDMRPMVKIVLISLLDKFHNHMHHTCM